MKCIIVLSIVLAVSLAEHYPTTFDYVDADTAYGNAEVSLAALGCYLKLYPCDPVNQFFSQYTQDCFDNAGAKLTERQKIIFGTFYRMAQKYHPHLVYAFNAKYDPTGKLTPALMQTLSVGNQQSNNTN